MRRIRIAPRPALAGLAVLVVVGLFGCSRSDGGAPAAQVPGDPAAVTSEEPAAEQTSAAPKTVEPCALVSKQEAEKLAGTPLEDAVPVRETCTYTGPVTGPTAQVEIYVGDGAKKYLDIERELGHDLKPLAGIGDEAYAEPGAVFISKSGLWVSIHLVRLDDPEKFRKPFEDLARQVATRM